MRRLPPDDIGISIVVPSPLPARPLPQGQRSLVETGNALHETFISLASESDEKGQSELRELLYELAAAANHSSHLITRYTPLTTDTVTHVGVLEMLWSPVFQKDFNVLDALQTEGTDPSWMQKHFPSFFRPASKITGENIREGMRQFLKLAIGYMREHDFQPVRPAPTLQTIFFSEELRS